MRMFLIFFALIPILLNAQKVTISGQIKEGGSREYLPYVNVLVKGTKKGTHSNAYGFYSVRIPAKQQVEIQFSFIGYHTVVHQISSLKDSVLNIELVPKEQELEEVTVTGGTPADDNPLSHVRLPVETIKQVPALLGEKDVIKALKLLPGVQRGTEGSTALF